MIAAMRARDRLLGLRRPDRLHPPRLPAAAVRCSSRCAAADRAAAARRASCRRVSLIVAAYDEEEVIAAKVANALALDYPRERLEVIVASDGSADAHRRARPRGRRRPRPRPAARRQGRRPERRRRARLAARSSPSPTPTASGRPTPCATWSRPSPTRRSATPAARSASPTQGGDNLEGAYWRYEMAVRELESGLAGVTAGNGAIYAVRAYSAAVPGERLADVQAGHGRVTGVEHQVRSGLRVDSRGFGMEAHRRCSREPQGNTSRPPP